MVIARYLRHAEDNSAAGQSITRYILHVSPSEWMRTEYQMRPSYAITNKTVCSNIIPCSNKYINIYFNVAFHPNICENVSVLSFINYNNVGGGFSTTCSCRLKCTGGVHRGSNFHSLKVVGRGSYTCTLFTKNTPHRDQKLNYLVGTPVY